MSRAASRDWVGKNFSEGSRLVWVAFQREGFKSFIDAEDAWDLGRSVLNRLMYGDRRAGRLVAVKLRDKLGVPIEAWHTEPTRRFRLPHLPVEAA